MDLQVIGGSAPYNFESQICQHDESIYCRLCSHDDELALTKMRVIQYTAAVILFYCVARKAVAAAPQIE